MFQKHDYTFYPIFTIYYFYWLQLDAPYDVILPRATANSQAMGSANSTLRADDAYVSQSKQASAQKDGRNGQMSEMVSFGLFCCTLRSNWILIPPSH